MFGRFRRLNIAERTELLETGLDSAFNRVLTLDGRLSIGWGFASIPVLATVVGRLLAGVAIGVTPGVLIGVVDGVFGPSFAQAREKTGCALAREQGLELFM